MMRIMPAWRPGFFAFASLESAQLPARWLHFTEAALRERFVRTYSANGASMKFWGKAIGAMVLCAGLCNSSYGFEWLDRLIGIDLDNSQGQGYAQPYSAGYAQPYSAGYAPYYSAGYASYSAGYPAPATHGCATCRPACCAAPQTCYRTVYMPVQVITYQPVAMCDSCGHQVTALRPVVTYRMQAQVVPYSAGP